MTIATPHPHTEGLAPTMRTNPYIGVLGVFLGASIATLNGRLVTVGLPDLRGELGFGLDDASWIPTVLNMATMFIGVFAVFLGAAYGIRRVLLFTGLIFTIASFLVPFFSGLPAMLILETLAGASSGTFYTLTFTFVARALPPKLLIFGCAAYAMDIVVTSHVATLIEGWYIDHLSWHWIFWTAAVITPVMMLCVYLGVPATDSNAPPSWRGFLYTSAGFALIYGALDQGQRLDWLNSGVFVGMLTGGVLLLLTALVRRYRQPNPLINLPFLNARNLIIMGLGIVTIRFALLAPLGVIPGFLGSIAQYRPIQTGTSLAWIAIPQFLLVLAAAFSISFIQPRIVMAGGFATIAIACWLAARLDSQWTGATFLLPELILAMGIAAAFVALLVNLALTAAEMGAAANVVNAATYAGWMHTMRLLGGQIGTVIFSHFVTVREQLHSNLLGYHVAGGDWITDDRLHNLALVLTPLSSAPEEATARAAAIVGGQVRAQALSLAYSDALLLIGWAIAGYLLLIAFMRPSSISLRPREKNS